MKNRLARIADWTELAERAAWKVGRLSRLCGVSPRVLERFFATHYELSPKKHLEALRLRRARSLLGGGLSLKEVAVRLGYAHACHLSRDLKAGSDGEGKP